MAVSAYRTLCRRAPHKPKERTQVRKCVARWTWLTTRIDATLILIL